jgi:hypothetical protein
MPVSPTGRALKLIVTASILRGEGLLFVKYSPPIDGQGGWILPTVDVADEQNPDAAAEAMLLSQLAISGVSLRISHTEAFVGRDGTWHVALHYYVRIKPDAVTNPQLPIAEHQWFSFDQLPSREHCAYHGWSADIAAAVRSKI